MSSCIHCLSTIEGGRVPRPCGLSVHDTVPSDLLQFDYIEIAPSRTMEKYIMMLRDDHLAYTWFFAFVNAADDNAAQANVD